MSLNPFTNKRKKKEDEVKDRIDSMQAEQQYQVEQWQQVQNSDTSDSFTLPENNDSYAAEDLNKYLPTTAQVEQQSPASGWSDSDATYEPPSRARQCLSKLQGGFMVGGALGGAVGFLYGTYTAIKHKHILYLPAAVIQAGAAFGFFLACGTVIRCEEETRRQAGDLSSR